MTRRLKRVKLKHTGRKMNYIIEASQFVTKNGGEIPKTRPGVMALRGDALHVSSVCLALTTDMAEFGIDVHVDSIMRHLDGKEGTITTEARVKKMVPDGTAVPSQRLVKNLTELIELTLSTFYISPLLSQRPYQGFLLVHNISRNNSSLLRALRDPLYTRSHLHVPNAHFLKS
jgi:hypothetical protein